MKKKALVFFVALIAVVIAIFVYAFIISFKVIKQNTDNINLALKEKFQSIVRIPEPIPPSLRSFNLTNYTWEMETREKEVTTVVFSHQTDFANKQDKIMASLETAQGADPSLFMKVLPAVVSDDQALQSAYDLEDPNLGPNNQIGYNKIELFTKDENSPQVTKILWEFDRGVITKDIENLFNNLDRYPEPVLKILYSIQRATLIMLAP